MFSIVEVTTYAQLIQPLTPDIQLTFSFDQESKNNQEKLPKKLTQPVYYDIPIKVKDILKVDYDFDGGLKRKSHKIFIITSAPRLRKVARVLTLPPRYF